MTDEIDFEEARREIIYETQDKLLSASFSGIKKVYRSLSEQERESVLGRLEELIDKAEKGEFLPLFDPKIARQIREDEGLSQMRLEKITGVDQSVISKYERGETKNPSNKNREYFRWLAEHGYDPLGFLEESD